MDKLAIPPSHYVAVVGYDEATKGWYPAAVDPTTGAVSQQTVGGAIDQLTNGQVTVTSSGILIVAARAGRSSVLIVNTGTNVVYLGGDVNVNAGNGVPLGANASITIPGSAAVYGKVVSTSQAVAYMEVY
jgi:hypothetical protein